MVSVNVPPALADGVHNIELASVVLAPLTVANPLEQMLWLPPAVAVGCGSPVTVTVLETVVEHPTLLTVNVDIFAPATEV